MILSQNTLGFARSESKYFYYWFMKNDSSLYNAKAFTRYIDIFEIDKLNSTIRGHINVSTIL